MGRQIGYRFCQQSKSGVAWPAFAGSFSSILLLVCGLDSLLVLSQSTTEVMLTVAALCMLSTIVIGLTIDAYGPINDNEGGISVMAGMSHRICERDWCS